VTPDSDRHDVGERLARIETKLDVLLEHHTETQAELVDLDVRLRAAETQLAGLTASIGGLRAWPGWVAALVALTALAITLGDRLFTR